MQVLVGVCRLAVYIKLDGTIWFPDDLGVQKWDSAVDLFLIGELNAAGCIYLGLSDT